MLKSKQKPFEYSIGEALQWAWDTPRKSIQIDTNILRYFLPFCDPWSFVLGCVLPQIYCLN